MAVTTIWFDDLNNEYEETFNEEEENGETLTEDAIYEIVLTINHMIWLKLHLPNGCNDFAESNINETEDGENKWNNVDDKLQNHKPLSKNTEKKTKKNIWWGVCQ